MAATPTRRWPIALFVIGLVVVVVGFVIVNFGVTLVGFALTGVGGYAWRYTVRRDRALGNR